MFAKWLGSLAGLAKRSARSLSNSLLQSGAKYWWGGSRISGVFGGQTAAGLDVTQETAMTVATVYACTQARAETLASLPPMVYLEVADNARRRDSNNRLWDLLHDSPNPEMDSMVFYELLQMRTINRGNGFAEIVRNNQDEPIELWPLHNSRVEPFRAKDNSLQWRVFTDAIDPRYEKYRYWNIPDRDMLNVVGFNSDGYIGQGVVPVAIEEIAANMAMTQYSASWFKSGAHPSAVVEHPGYIDDEADRARFRADMNTLHSGREHWHEIPVVWENAKWKQVQFSPEQSQLTASKGYSDKTICRFYKVPPALVQIFDDYKFSTVDAMIQQFVMTCLRADAVRLERAIRRKVMFTRNGRGELLRIFDNPYVFEFVLEALLRGDAKKQAETLEIERRNGVTNANEWRALNNREPLPGAQGEIYTVVGGFENLQTLGSTYPKGNPSRKSRSEDDDETENRSVVGRRLPSFDKPRLLQALEAGVPAHRDRLPGGSVADATTVRDELDVAALEVFQEAVGRVEAIAKKECSRVMLLPEDKREEKLANFWPKHGARLSAAILPAAKLWTKYRDCDAESLAADVGAWVAENRMLLGDAVGLDVFEGLST